MGKLVCSLLVTTSLILLLPLSFARGEQKLTKLRFNYTKVKVGEAQIIGFFDFLKEVLARDNLFMVKLSDTFHAEVVFFDRNYEKAVFVKYGFSLDQDVYGKIIELPEGILTHNKDRHGTSYALFFEGYDKEGVYPLLNALNFSTSTRINHSGAGLFQTLLWPVAHAQEECLKGTESPFRDLQKVRDWTKTPAAPDHSCVIRSFFQAHNSQTAEIISAEDNWNKTKQFWSSVKKFNRDVSEILKTAKNEDKISLQKEISVKCNVIKSLPSTVLDSYLSHQKVDLKELNELVEKALKAR